MKIVIEDTRLVVERTEDDPTLGELVDMLTGEQTIEDIEVDWSAEAEKVKKARPQWYTASGTNVRVGEEYEDLDAPAWGTATFRVNDVVTDQMAKDYEYEEGVTVADANPSHPETATVVLGQYLTPSGSESKQYALPITRLAELD